jgi:hypothetical protein
MKFRTLKEKLYVNGKPVLKAFANGNLVYPDKVNYLKIYQFSYSTNEKQISLYADATSGTHWIPSDTIPTYRFYFKKSQYSYSLASFPWSISGKVAIKADAPFKNELSGITVTTGDFTHMSVEISANCFLTDAGGILSGDPVSSEGGVVQFDRAGFFAAFNRSVSVKIEYDKLANIMTTTPSDNVIVTSSGSVYLNPRPLINRVNTEFAPGTPIVLVGTDIVSFVTSGLPVVYIEGYGRYKKETTQYIYPDYQRFGYDLSESDLVFEGYEDEFVMSEESNG